MNRLNWLKGSHGWHCNPWKPCGFCQEGGIRYPENQECVYDWKDKVLWTIRQALDFFNRDKQDTFVYCECGMDLVSQEGNVISNKENGEVIFQCDYCDVRTAWDFSAPAPLKLDYSKVARYEEW